MQQPWTEYRRFVGFYWTYPVPAAGFTKLPREADAAAALSRTIRYQRDRVRAYVQDCKGELAEEIVHLEAQADRGTESIEPELLRALKACKGDKAQLLHVDFSLEAGWRHHPFLMRLMQQAPVSCLGLAPDAMLIDGTPFDPIAHFKQCREAAAMGKLPASERRQALEARIAEVASQVAEGSGRYGQIAEQLNSRGIHTITGRAWTEGNVKQFLRALGK